MAEPAPRVSLEDLIAAHVAAQRCSTFGRTCNPFDPESVSAFAAWLAPHLQAIQAAQIRESIDRLAQHHPLLERETVYACTCAEPGGKTCPVHGGLIGPNGFHGEQRR